MLFWDWFVQIRAVDPGSLIGRARDMMGQRRGWFQLSRVQIAGFGARALLGRLPVLPARLPNQVYSWAAPPCLEREEGITTMNDGIVKQ